MEQKHPKLDLNDRNILDLKPFSTEIRNGKKIWPLRYVYDLGQPHLLLLLSPTNRRTWYFEKKTGHGRLVKIGEWPAVTAEQARELIKKYLKATKEGTAPRAFRKQLEKVHTTYKKAFDYYVEGHLRLHASASTLRNALNGFKRYCECFHEKRVIEITSHDVQTWVNWVGETFGRATANKEFSIFKACIRYCELHEIIELRRDPTRGITRFGEQPRERYVRRGAEFEGLKDVLNARRGPTADAIWMMLLTGARRSNVLAIRWEEIDWSEATWRIPRTKSGQSQLVLLSGRAMEILRSRYERRNAEQQIGDFRLYAPDSPWVFPCNTKSGHLASVQHAWEKIRLQAGLDGLHIHDLRHTAGSMLGMTGASAFVIQRVLGHSTSRMTERYTHLDTNMLRSAIEKAQEHLFGEEYKPKPVPPDELTERRLARTQQQPVEPAAEVPSYRRPKNADIQISPHEQVLVEAKILQAIAKGGSTKQSFYKKIGACFRVNAREMSRILTEMIGKGLIEPFYIDGGLDPEMQIRYRLAE